MKKHLTRKLSMLQDIPWDELEKRHIGVELNGQTYIKSDVSNQLKLKL